MHSISRTASRPVDRTARWTAGSALGPWRLERLLGEGAWTQVFLAAPIDSSTNSTADYVIKMIKPEFTAEAAVIGMLQRQAFVSQCVSHPHMACVLSAHVDRPPFFLVMPFQPGSTVGELLRDNGRLPPAQALWIARQTSECLAVLHANHWLHGDIKSDNVFLAVNGHVTVCDFGFARKLSASQNRRDIVLGTPAYLAPESFSESIPESPASDVYALGVMLFEMLTGSRPFNDSDGAELLAAHRQLPPPDPRISVPQLSNSVCRLLRQMLAKEPLRRPVGAELIEQLVDLEIDAFDERL